MKNDLLDDAPEMVPFVTGEELARAALSVQLAKEAVEMSAFWKRHQEGVESGHRRHMDRERRRLERPR